jgi:hypothetical protein
MELLNFLDRFYFYFFKHTQVSKFHEKQSNVSQVEPSGQTRVTKLTVALRKFAKRA